MQMSRDGVFNWRIALLLSLPAAACIFAFQLPHVAPAPTGGNQPIVPAPLRVASAETKSTTEEGREVTADNSTAAGNRALLAEYRAPPADHSESAAYQREWWMVKGAIKYHGYPCASVAYVTEMAAGTFKAICKLRHGTNKYVGFVIDPDNEVVRPVTK